jgi:hypothetical protein
MNSKLVFIITILLIMTIVLALFYFQKLDRNGNPSSTKRDFYVGVEYAYGYDNQTAQEQLAQLQALVDKVKDYANLLVVGSLGLTFNQTALSQACDYIYNANLSIIVLFTGLDVYERLPPSLMYNTTVWMRDAQQKYGEKFLGIWRYDEPGGRTLEQGIDPIIHKRDITMEYDYVDVANLYFERLHIFPNYYLDFSPKVFTADFGLYWFDYRADYTSLFAEFVGNESRERHIALCRGAADTFGRDWGAIVTWKYSQSPYLESPDELYADLALAYGSGAKYIIVFSYPQLEGTEFGILTEQHFDALKRFWDEVQSDPTSFSSSNLRVAYVLPAGYGFGFRHPDDTIWGVFPADSLSAKIFNDVNNTLPQLYGSNFDVLYDQPPLTQELLEHYSKVYYWNKTIT